MDLIHNKSSSSRKIQNQLIMYRKVIENPYIRISIRRLKSKKRAKILGSRFAEAVPPAESLKARAEQGQPYLVGKCIPAFRIWRFSFKLKTEVSENCIEWLHQPLRERPRGGLKDLRAPPGNASTITGPAVAGPTLHQGASPGGP